MSNTHDMNVRCITPALLDKSFLTRGTHNLTGVLSGIPVLGVLSVLGPQALSPSPPSRLQKIKFTAAGPPWRSLRVETVKFPFQINPQDKIALLMGDLCSQYFHLKELKLSLCSLLKNRMSHFCYRISQGCIGRKKRRYIESGPQRVSQTRSTIEDHKSLAAYVLKKNDGPCGSV